MQIKINDNKIECKEGKTVLEVLTENGIKVPTLCYHPDMKPGGRCRMCIVEIDGQLRTSCNNYVSEGMDIKTDTKEVRKARKINAELLYSHYLFSSLKENKHEFSDVIEDLGLTDTRFKALIKPGEDKTNPSITRERSKCILCGRCVQACSEFQSVHAIDFADRGVFTKIAASFGKPLSDVACTLCGQCSLACPSGAIQEKDDIALVEKAIADKSKHVIIQVAPSIRASIGEAFGLEPGTLVTKRLVTALRKLGFDKVFDTNFAADLTIMEEGTEFLKRIEKNEKLPLITSCSPGWIKFIEHFYPELIENLSTCKSPQQMFGAIAKTYYAEKEKINPKDIFVVSAMPCTAKKYECLRQGMDSSGYQDVDVVLTNRELARFLKKNHINLPELERSEFDLPLGMSTGAGVMFGATGGVMEAALRTAYEIATGKPVEKLEFDQIRGLDKIKKGSIEINGSEIRFVVGHGLSNARKIMEEVKEDPLRYHFIEIMACQGGCIGGGGQIKPTNKKIIEKRIEAIYKEDADKEIRVSHKNPEIIQLYKEFLGEPLSSKSHKLLHTKYKKRSKF